MKILSWLIFIPFAVIVVTFAVANRGPIPIDFWPLPFQQDVPLYLISLGTLAFGAFFGGILTWMSVAKWRIVAMSRKKDLNFAENEIERLNQELKKLKAEAEEARSMTVLPPPTTGDAA